MKFNFKKLTLAICGVTGLMLMTYCTRTPDNDRDTAYNDNTTVREKDPKDVAENNNNEMIEGRRAEKDAQFLVDAAEITLKEIELGRLAQSKSTDPEVKKMGQMMVTDHTKSLNEIKDLASKKGIQVPIALTEDVKDSYVRMADKKETDFNEDYCDVMVREHKDAIDKFENASKNAEDPEIRAWAASALPGLRTHLQHADMCQEKDKDSKKASASIK